MTKSNMNQQGLNIATYGQAYLSVEITSKKLEKSECWVVKWSSRNEGFEDNKKAKGED